MAAPRPAAGDPLFSFVIAVYDVGPYLPEFLASLDLLECESDAVEMIFVDDGSTDDSASLVEEWLATSRFAGCCLRKTNGGPGSARNLGLSRARGTWVSFPDPDDVLSPGYLGVVTEFLASPLSSRAAMIAGRPIRFTDSPAAPIAPHALDFKYADDERVVDLTVSPEYVQLHTIVGFYRRDLITSHCIAFDEEIRPVFEDAVFNIDYLSQAERPTVALLRRARYFYRRRADSGSLTGAAFQDRRMFDDLPRGYLRVLERAGRPAPRWVQNTVYYDLQWMFKAQHRPSTGIVGLSPDELAEYGRLLHQILRLLDDDTLLQFNAVGIPVRIRLSFLARKHGKLEPDRVFASKLDVARQLVLLSYFTSDPQPSEEIRLEGVAAQPAFTKSIGIRHFGVTDLYQRDLWIPAHRRITLRVDGKVLPVVLGFPAGDVYNASPHALWRRYANRQPPRAVPPAPGSASRAPLPSAAGGSGRVRGVDRPKRWWKEQLSRPVVRAARRIADAGASGLRLRVTRPTTETSLRSPGIQAAIRRRAATPSARRRFRSAWILVDRSDSARDNAEAFYRYLRRQQPSVNAWFVLSRSSSDWSRLEADGFRLIDFGSIQHMIALRHARYLVSSQADNYLVRPPVRLFGRRRWKFVFLQHGVTHNDVSRWINSLPIRTMITATPAEHQSIVGQGTPYQLSEKEVHLAGFPRHDELLRRALPIEQRDLLLVAPTWRSYLLLPQGFGHERPLAGDLRSSDFMSGWVRFLSHPALESMARAQGLQIAFLVHPHLQPHVTADMMPRGVTLLSMSVDDVQGLLTRARVLVTDYSSLAFEAAYLDTPVVYHQFDSSEFFSGRHTVRAGSFSFHDHGFGPVVPGTDEAVAAVATALDPLSADLEVYRRRARDTFVFRDGRCCERVYEAILSSEVPAADPLTEHHEPLAGLSELGGVDAAYS